MAASITPPPPFCAAYLDPFAKRKRLRGHADGGEDLEKALVRDVSLPFAGATTVARVDRRAVDGLRAGKSV